MKEEGKGGGEYFLESNSTGIPLSVSYSRSREWACTTGIERQRERERERERDVSLKSVYRRKWERDNNV
jgi:hypothetical protein